MEKDVHRLKSRMDRSKIAIFAIIGFLALITYLLVVVAQEVKTQENLTSEPKAFDIIGPGGEEPIFPGNPWKPECDNCILVNQALDLLRSRLWSVPAFNPPDDTLCGDLIGGDMLGAPSKEGDDLDMIGAPGINQECQFLIQMKYYLWKINNCVCVKPTGSGWGDIIDPTGYIPLPTRGIQTGSGQYDAGQE